MRRKNLMRLQSGGSGSERQPGPVKQPGQKIAEGVPLAMLYKREIKASPDVVMLSDPRSIASERFRRLKTRLINQFGTRVVAVTSGIPGEGKSTVCINLALAFASEGIERTLLVDADLRRPSIGSRLSLAPQLGIAELLEERTGPEHAILHLKESSLDILPAGALRSVDPAQLLASNTAQQLFSSLRESYDRIVIDTPPIIPFTDADVVGRLTDGILLVARAGVTPKSAYKQEIAAITSTKILGTVLNASSAARLGSNSSYDRYYRDYYESERSE